jgi:hypothetical protein
VVDNTSTRDLRQKPYQVANFGEGIVSVDEMFNKIVYTQMNLDYPSIKVLLVHKAERSWSTVNLQVFITLFVNFPVSD